MRRILIMKLTRMGDLLEAAPMLRKIRALEPDASITLVINETFRDVASLLQDVDAVLSFPFFSFAEELKEGLGDVADHLQRLESFADTLSREHYDLAINATNSQISGVLMGFVRADAYRGLRYDDDGTRQVQGALIRYFGANEGMRRYVPFNLSDFLIALYQADGNPSSTALRISAAAKHKATALLEGVQGRPLVGIQLGASESCKRWPPGAYAQTALRLLEAGVGVVLIGGEGEQPLSRIFLRALEGAAGPLVDLVGKTSVEVLAAVLEQCQVLVTNDTGPMHLAAALETKVINLSLGSAYFRETGPYGEGHYILEPRISCRPCHFAFRCDHLSCRERISPELVSKLTLAILADDPLRLALCAEDSSCDLFQTTFGPDGLLEHIRLSKRPSLADELHLEVYRMVLAQGELGGRYAERLAEGRKRLEREGTTATHEVRAELSSDRILMSELEELAHSGLLLVKKTLEAQAMGSHSLIAQALEEMGRCDERIEAYGAQHVVCRLLARGFVLEKESIRGNGLAVLLMKHRECYARLAMAARHYQWGLELILDSLEDGQMGTDEPDVRAFRADTTTFGELGVPV